MKSVSLLKMLKLMSYDVNAIKNDIWTKETGLFEDLQMSFDNLNFNFVRVMTLQEVRWDILIGNCDKDTCSSDLSHICSDHCRKQKWWKWEYVYV